MSLPCAGYPAIFTAAADDDQLATSRAKALCSVCPNRVECRDAAIARCEPVGVWGALTGEQRAFINPPPELLVHRGPVGRANLEDVEFLAAAGESWEAIAKRCGVKISTVERLLERHHRPDLVERINRSSVIPIAVRRSA